MKQTNEEKKEKMKTLSYRDYDNNVGCCNWQVALISKIGTYEI